MIGIIDYGMGNLGSVRNACAFLGVEASVLESPDGMEECGALILPGVGAFGDCMRHLEEHGFVGPVTEWIESGRPFLGICLGLQVLYEGSEESPGVPGFGLLPGTVTHFEQATAFKVPQIGWNRVRQAQPDCPLFEGVEDETYFYFVHSYYAPADGAPVVAGITDYGLEYASAICRDNLMAVQFHPEKSQKKGLKLLRNFTDWALEGANPLAP